MMNIKLRGCLLIVIAHALALVAGCGQQATDTGPGRIILAQQGPPGTHPYKQDYDFTIDWFTRAIPVWEKALAPYKGKPNLNYLEVGAYEGRSIVWMLENVLTDPSARVTAVDVFYDQPDWDTFSLELHDRFHANIKKAGGASKTTTIIGFSQEELRKLPLDHYDIIYIDGSHMGPDVLEDVLLSDRLLKEGGMLILDDYLWTTDDPAFPLSEDPDLRNPKLAIDTFIKFFGAHFRIIHWNWQVIMIKESA